jgi:hypothetical protein
LNVPNGKKFNGPTPNVIVGKVKSPKQLRHLKSQHGSFGISSKPHTQEAGSTIHALGEQDGDLSLRRMGVGNDKILATETIINNKHFMLF